LDIAKSIEEVSQPKAQAQLAGISVGYITRLEQGRATNPSAQVIEAPARGLRLSRDGRSHPFQLAGLVPPGSDSVSAHITPSVPRMLDRLNGTPVAVFDAAWTQLLANRRSARTGPGTTPARRRTRAARPAHPSR
jgi:transcriptional regulator with XRE-family HTH domain